MRLDAAYGALRHCRGSAACRPWDPPSLARRPRGPGLSTCASSLFSRIRSKNLWVGSLRSRRVGYAPTHPWVVASTTRRGTTRCEQRVWAAPPTLPARRWQGAARWTRLLRCSRTSLCSGALIGLMPMPSPLSLWAFPASKHPQICCAICTTARKYVSLIPSGIRNIRGFTTRSF